MSKVIVVGALVALLCLSTVAHKASQSQLSSAKTHADDPAVGAQAPYQHRDTWYEFMLKQVNPENVDYGRWLEERRQEFIQGRIKNPYFGCTVFLSLALFVMSAVCVKQWIDHRRCMSITAEMMADLYRQDSYSRQVAHEAIDRYNKHIERCNRAIEAGENALAAPAANNEVEQLRTELMRVAEERDTVIRERDIAREDLRKKAEILADLSVRLEALTKSGGANVGKTSADLRGADGKLIAHINNLQEQLYAERNHNRRLRGG